jgi:hypothetical protein
MECRVFRCVKGESLRLRSGPALEHPAAQSRRQTGLIAPPSLPIVLAKNSL